MAEWRKFKLLGKGSYAEVYLATIILPKPHNEKVVAVKCSTPFSFSIASLEKERKILELFIGCKEILQYYFYQYSMERGFVTYNLFMEFAPCGSFLDLIRKGPLLKKEVIAYTYMLLKGLSCIHERGVVHCDLKPDNILLFPSSDGYTKYQLKIADFGLSRTREETTTDLGDIKFRGTPFYMSPESMVGLIETPLDIWSLGCIIIEMITGFPPWSNLQTKEELMQKLAFLRETPKIPNGLDWDCENFLSKCFVKDPQQRWTAVMLLEHPFIRKEYPTSRFNSLSFFSYDIVSCLPHKI